MECSLWDEYISHTLQMENINYLFARVVVRVKLFWGGEVEEAWCGCGQKSRGRDRPGWGWPVTDVVRVEVFGVD